MTEITQKIAKEIIDTATAENSYYNVPLDKSNIRYYFKLKDKLITDKAIAGAEASIIVQYGHIFSEGFGGASAKPSMVSSFLMIVVGMALAYGYYLDTEITVTTYHEGPKVKAKGINLETLTANDIESITVTDSKGTKIIYNKVKGPAATTPSPDSPSITITKDGRETKATFTKGDPDSAPPDTPKNTIILKTTLTGTKGEDTITITGKPTGATVDYGHIFTETFDTSKVHTEIVSPTLMVIVGMGHLIVTIFPPVIIAFLRLKGNVWSPQHNLRGSWGI
uniref:Uncharacterized protein n=1 Tax=Theileria annulata TaxID=5874 RepID=A0A3B0MWM3_THEAN